MKMIEKELLNVLGEFNSDTILLETRCVVVLIISSSTLSFSYHTERLHLKNSKKPLLLFQQYRRHHRHHLLQVFQHLHRLLRHYWPPLKRCHSFKFLLRHKLLQRPLLMPLLQSWSAPHLRVPLLRSPNLLLLELQPPKFPYPILFFLYSTFICSRLSWNFADFNKLQKFIVKTENTHGGSLSFS